MNFFIQASSKYPLLNKQQEIELGRRIQAWLTHPEPVPKGIRRSGMRAREQFVLSNLRLVAKVAGRYSRFLPGTGLAFDDLLQEGVLGLQRAAEKYDPECGYAYSTYAMWWIRQAMYRAIDTKGSMIRTSAGAKRKLRDYSAGLAQGLNREEALTAAGLKQRDLLIIERAALCKSVVALDALGLSDVL